MIKALIAEILIEQTAEYLNNQGNWVEFSSAMSTIIKEHIEFLIMR